MPNKKVHKQKIAEVPNTCSTKSSWQRKQMKEKETNVTETRKLKETEETTDEHMDEHKEDMKR